MGDFKAQLEADMKVFFNPAEFAQIVNIWYLEEQYTVPAIIKHTSAAGRKKRDKDHAEGMYQADCQISIALSDLGFVPRKDRNIEIEEAGAVNIYRIRKADCKDGKITLELEWMDE